jgi:undecaprenyl-diphosphatase
VALRRRFTVPIAVVLLLAVAVLGAKVRGGAWPLGVDREAVALLSNPLVRLWSSAARRLGLPALRPAAVVVQLGSPVALVLAAALLGVWATLRRDWPTLALVAISPVLASSVTEALLKPLVARHLGLAFTYPSGHTTGAGTLAALVLFVTLRLADARFVRRLWIPALLYPVLVGVAVVKLGWHYPTDAVAGASVGFAVVMLVDAAVPGVVHHRARPPRTRTAAESSPA